MENVPTAQSVIDANPTACWRTLEMELYRLGLLDEAGYRTLLAARPQCGYRCDGGEGPHPLNGSPGCYYSGRLEP